MKLLKLKCERCAHRWVPRKKNINVCPKCKSPYWNIKQKKQLKYES